MKVRICTVDGTGYNIDDLSDDDVRRILSAFKENGTVGGVISFVNERDTGSRGMKRRQVHVAVRHIVAVEIE